MPNTVKYISYAGLQKFYEMLQDELAKSSGSVLPVAYATAAGSATNDNEGNPISSTYLTIDGAEDTYVTLADTSYVKTVKLKGSGASSYTTLSTSNNTVEIDLHEYALKSEITAALHFKGVVATQAALPSSNVAVGDLYIVTTGPDTGETNVEYVCTAIDPSITWEKLGPTKDFSGFATKLDTTAAGYTAGNILKSDANGNIADTGVSATVLSGGSVAENNTSFVTGGDVWDAIDELDTGISEVQVNGTALVPSSGSVNIDMSAYTASSLVANDEEPVNSVAVLAAIAGHAEVKRITANSDTASPTYAADVNTLQEASEYEIAALFV